MKDKDLDTSRLEIIKSYLETGEILNLDETLGISLLSAKAGIYHIFSNEENGLLVHQNAIADKGLTDLVNTLPIPIIKQIYTNSRLLKLRNKYVADNNKVVNPLDYENYK